MPLFKTRRVESSCRVAGTWARPPELGFQLWWHILRVKCPQQPATLRAVPPAPAPRERTAWQTGPRLGLPAFWKGLPATQRPVAHTAVLAHLHKTKCWVFTAQHKMDTHQLLATLNSALGTGFLKSLLPLPWAHSLCPPLSPSMVMKSHALSSHSPIGASDALSHRSCDGAVTILRVLSCPGPFSFSSRYLPLPSPVWQKSTRYSLMR